MQHGAVCGVLGLGSASSHRVSRFVFFPRAANTTPCDPVIEEHFRRSLGKNYKEPEPAATNSVSITGSVDDHFAKALGDTWLQIKNKGSPSSSNSSPNSSPNSHNMVNHNHSPSVVS